jgi:NAD(P)-dependent dehydrogenase (short-subunit alcohol dehydrogenase family)
MSARVAVVTGAASGMGRRMTDRLTGSGWAVAAVDLPGPRLGAVALESGATPYPCDVTDAEQVGATAAEVFERFGAVDRLANAAGIAVRGRIDELPASAFARAMAVNYLGTVHWVQAVLPRMRERDAGELVLFASLAGWLPTPAMAAYTATKFAVVGFGDTLAMEVRGSGLVVRCVCPGAVQTPMLDDIMGQGVPERLKTFFGVVSADVVLDAVEKSLARRRQYDYVLPGLSTKLLWRVRRLLPALLRSGIPRIDRS